ncbi:helix-turn-helix domain-containing protein [Kocuria marina]|uniref:helix-turn-helix domain-containing protein n=1 Tax=Kocuria marina TaxID=223184 RepID=UPI0034604FE7
MGISRPTLVKLLEQGDIPFTKVGRHRRVLLTDLIAYEERLEKTRREGLRQATHETANHGTYFDIPADPATR